MGFCVVACMCVRVCPLCVVQGVRDDPRYYPPTTNQKQKQEQITANQEAWDETEPRLPTPPVHNLNHMPSAATPEHLVEEDVDGFDDIPETAPILQSSNDYEISSALIEFQVPGGAHRFQLLLSCASAFLLPSILKFLQLVWAHTLSTHHARAAAQHRLQVALGAI